MTDSKERLWLAWATKRQSVHGAYKRPSRTQNLVCTWLPVYDDRCNLLHNFWASHEEVVLFGRTHYCAVEACSSSFEECLVIIFQVQFKRWISQPFQCNHYRTARVLSVRLVTVFLLNLDIEFCLLKSKDKFVRCTMSELLCEHMPGTAFHTNWTSRYILSRRSRWESKQSWCKYRSWLSYECMARRQIISSLSKGSLPQAIAWSTTPSPMGLCINMKLQFTNCMPKPATEGKAL